jgi:hypothetical protein
MKMLRSRVDSLEGTAHRVPTVVLLRSFVGEPDTPSTIGLHGASQIWHRADREAVDAFRARASGEAHSHFGGFVVLVETNATSGGQGVSCV